MFLLKRLVLALLICVGAATSAQAADLTTIKNAGYGVTIAVTPQGKADAGPEFKVVMDTHSQDLSDDLLKSAVLVDGAGNRHAPTAWEGAGPGGHHREGVLRFPPISATLSMELQITRPKEQSPRTFRWELQ